jgi:hypothetical protein
MADDHDRPSAWAIIARLQHTPRRHAYAQGGEEIPTDRGNGSSHSLAIRDHDI